MVVVVVEWASEVLPPKVRYGGSSGPFELALLDAGMT